MAKIFDVIICYLTSKRLFSSVEFYYADSYYAKAHKLVRESFKKVQVASVPRVVHFHFFYL